MFRTAATAIISDNLERLPGAIGLRPFHRGGQMSGPAFTVRILLEPHATELAVQRGGDALVERLEANNDTMAAAIARADEEAIEIIQATNRDFHHTLLAFSGSPRLRSIVESMIDMPIVVRSFFLYSSAELAQSLHHHRDITLAARIRDGELGKRAMQLHLKMSHARVVRHRLSWRQAPGSTEVRSVLSTGSRLSEKG
jgi:DNA-binding GntR family transcriptional regulator